MGKTNRWKKLNYRDRARWNRLAVSYQGLLRDQRESAAKDAVKTKEKAAVERAIKIVTERDKGRQNIREEERRKKNLEMENEKLKRITEGRKKALKDWEYITYNRWDLRKLQQNEEAERTYRWDKDTINC